MKNLRSSFINGMKVGNLEASTRDITNGPKVTNTDYREIRRQSFYEIGSKRLSIPRPKRPLEKLFYNTGLLVGYI